MQLLNIILYLQKNNNDEKMERYTIINCNNFEVAEITRIINKNELAPIEDIQNIIRENRIMSTNLIMTEPQLSLIMFFMEDSKLKDLCQKCGNITFGWYK